MDEQVLKVNLHLTLETCTYMGFPPLMQTSNSVQKHDKLTQHDSVFLRQAQYSGTKLTQGGLRHIECPMQVGCNPFGLLPQYLSPEFGEVGAIHCRPSVSFSQTAPRCSWYSLRHFYQ